MSAEQNEFVGWIPQAVLRTALVRAGMVVFCAACLGLVYWSLTVHLPPVNREMRAAVLEESRLSDAVAGMRLDLKPGPAEETRARFKAAQAKLFQRPEQFRAWQTQIRRKAASLALEAKVTLEPAQPYPGAEAKLAYTQAGIEIAPLAATGPTAKEPAYYRLVNFAQALAGQGRQWDLVSLTVEGNSNSVQRAEAVALLLSAPKEAK
jgi:hypothetical protein